VNKVAPPLMVPLLVLARFGGRGDGECLKRAEGLHDKKETY
jgi:hypothetical protein